MFIAHHQNWGFSYTAIEMDAAIALPSTFIENGYSGTFCSFYYHLFLNNFYIIDLSYFATPPAALGHLLNDLTVVVTTCGWSTSYHSMQLVYSVPDPTNPRWNKPVMISFFSNCCSIVDLEVYYGN